MSGQIPDNDLLNKIVRGIESSKENMCDERRRRGPATTNTTRRK